MAVIFSHSSCTSLLLCHFSSRQSAKTTSHRMDLNRQNDQSGHRKFLDFPYVSAPHRSMMVDLVSTVESRLAPQLLPCTLPHDVQSYQNQSGTSHAALHIRSGLASSPIDFMLGSWIHSDLPTGGALDITSLSLYLKPSTDAPNFSLDMIQSSPTSSILLLDLTPRKDLVLHPNYLHKFYEATNLESQRQSLSRVPEVGPFFSPTLHIRSLLSPTAIMVRIEAGTVPRMEEIVEGHVHRVAKEVLRVWLEECFCVEREVSAAEKECIQRRDKMCRLKTIEVELGTSLPRLFGPEIAKRVIDVMSEYFFAS